MIISEAKKEYRRQRRAEGIVITVKRCGSMKRHSIYIHDGKKRSYKMGHPGLPRDPSHMLKKVKNQWINQGRRGYMYVTSKLIQSILIYFVFTFHTSTSGHSQWLKMPLGITPKKQSLTYSDLLTQMQLENLWIASLHRYSTLC